MVGELKLKWAQNIDELVAYVSSVIEKETGNILGPSQKAMVSNRLQRRITDLKLGDVSHYMDYLNKNYKSEIEALTSLLTTHHTFFFREFSHFEYLRTHLETIVNQVKKRGEKKIKILSAACSKGQEPYSLAMFFHYHLQSYPGMDFEIMATDIDKECVAVATNGVYPYSEIKSVPQIYLSGNWQRGTGEISKFVKVKKHLKERCQFHTMNLKNLAPVLSSKKFDIIFCRNVFIYFNLDEVKNIVSSFSEYIYDNGLFVTGLSESLKSLNLDIKNLAPSVNQIKWTEEAPKVEKPLETQEKPKPPAIPSPMRVLAVDDSASILKLLKKIFDTDDQFELVGTASNGLEAQEFLKSNKVDAMTLDIHMPEMDGVEYLKKNFRKGHPHVLVVSSASREDVRYAQETLKHGASDFVEKPALNNLMERAEEIKNKLRMAFLNSQGLKSGLDKDFKQNFTIKNPSQKARVFIGNYSDKEKIKSSVKELKGDQPPLFLFFEGNYNYLEALEQEFKSLGKVSVYSEELDLSQNHIYICDFSKHYSNIINKISTFKRSYSVFGILSKNVLTKLLDEHGSQVLVEDTPGITKEVREVAQDIFPWTSFAHLGTEYLAKD